MSITFLFLFPWLGKNGEKNKMEEKKQTESKPKISKFSVFGRVIRKGVCTCMNTSVYSKRFGEFIKRYDNEHLHLTERDIITYLNEAEEISLEMQTHNEEFDSGKAKTRDIKKDKTVATLVIDTKDYRIAVFVPESQFCLTDLSAMRGTRK